MMTNEEWNRKIEFILNQQAKFDADMQELNQKLNQELKEAEAKAAKAAERTEKSLSQLADATLELIATIRMPSSQIPSRRECL